MDPVLDHLLSGFLSLYSVGVRDRLTYSSILKQALLANAHLLSTWTVWEPNALDGQDEAYRTTRGHDDSGRFVHCWHRAHGKQELVPVIDYDVPLRGKWYSIPKEKLTPCHLDPIPYRFGKVHVCITSTIAPLIHEGKFFGVVGIDLKASKHSEGCRKAISSGKCPAWPMNGKRHPNLTPREHEVYHWMRNGKTNEEIGMILGISHHTVKNHIEHIFQKIGVNNRYEAMLAAS